jgi:hypothetical protein
MLNVEMVFVPVYLIIRVTLILVVDLNVSSIQTVPETRHVCKRNVKIHVREHVDKMLSVRC